MRLVRRWFDSGWPYEWWECWSPDGRIGFGHSATQAYKDWRAE